MKKTLSRSVSLLLTLAMVISLLAVPVSAATWDNVSETRYASRYVTSDYATGKFYDNMTKIPLTGDGARDVVAVAASQVGYIEGSSSAGYDGETGGSSNYTEYGCFMGLTGGTGHAWCAAFCAWSFYVAEVTDLQGSQYDTDNGGNIWADAYVPYWSEYLIEQGRYKAAYQFRNSYSDLYDASYVPQPGDLVFFYTASGDYPGWEGHIGLVAYSDGTYVYTLEGNTSSQDGVESEGGGAFFKKYDLKGSSLVGFGSMPYETVDGLPEIDYTGANPTPGLYVTTSGAKSVYQNINDSTASWTLPMSSVFEVLDIDTDSDGNVMLYSKCEINGSTVYGWITHGSDSNGYTKTLQIYASGEAYEDPNDLDKDGIPDSYGVSIEDDGTRVFDNSYGFTFKIDDTNGTIEGEDATLITTASAYASCNPNWAISVQLRPTGNASEYEVVKVVECPGSASAAGITLEDDDVILVVHSADSQPGTYANWMSKVAAVALKEGDILTFNATNTTATVSRGESVEPTEPEVTEPEVTEPEVTEPEITEPEVTEPEVTEPEVTEPEVTEPAIEVPDYGGLIPGAGVPGTLANPAANFAFGCDLSFYNVNDTDYRDYITNDDSGADYSLVDFQAMKASGCDFVILRMGASDDNGYYTDPHFYTYYDLAREAGMDIGVYFYSYAMSTAEAIEEAEYVIDILDASGMYFEYPIYIDIEEADQIALGSTAVSAIAEAWCETMYENGYFPGIYGAYNLFNILTTEIQEGYDLWLAYISNSDGSVPTPETDNISDDAGIWQFTFEGQDRFEGIGREELDVNVSYKDYASIMKAYGYNNVHTTSEPTEPTEPTEPEVTEPEVTEPEVTEPEVTEPEVTEPEVTEPEVTEPEVTEPEVTDPDADGDGILDCYGVYVEDGIYAFTNSYGYVFEIEDVNGTIEGEDATIITSSSYYSSCNPNWAISVHLRLTGTSADEYEVVKVVECPGSASAAGISLQSGDVILVVHSAASYPGAYANWMSKIAAVALKEGDIIEISSDNTTATVIGPAEEEEPEVTEPEVTEPEVTEPEVTEPEVTEPEVTEPAVEVPNYGGAIAGAGQQGYADNLYYGVDISYHNVNDTSYHNYETDDDSGADYSLLDFEAMKASGCDYVIIRIGSEDSYGKFIDPHFLTMYNLAREAGMDIGLYFYSLALTYDEAVEDAEFVLDYLEQYDFTFEYPVYIDIEEEDQLALSTTELDAIAYGWCETMVDAGYFPGIYTGYYASQTMSSTLKGDYDMWIAAYTTGVGPEDDNLSAECSMWQYTSTGTGDYEGIGKDDIDMNVCYKDYPAIMAAGGYNNMAQTTEPEVTEPEVTEPEVTEPEVTEPEVTEPEVTEPEVTDPDADGDGILDCYGVYVEDGIYAFTNSYGYVFDIEDVNGTIEGEDATIITTSSAYSSCNPNWAISVQLRPTDDGKYQVVKVVECPGSASAAGITLESGDIIMVVHSAASYPGDYENWMSKIAAVALKKGDIIEIASDNSTATVISAGELEETEEPEATEPEVTVPDSDIPNYGGAIAGAGIPGSADNLYYGCDVSFYNVNDTSYANYTTSDDSGADYSLLDFEAMKADGCDFVILRMGSSDSSGYYTDPHFFTLYNMAREAGMDIGLYFYSYAMNYNEAVEEAEYVISVLDSYDMYFEYPIYIDIEESDQLALSESVLSNICYGWCETMVNAGYYPGIYGNYNLYDAVSTDIQNDYDFWVAWVSSATSQSAYNPSTHNISNEASMWQYSFYGYEYDGVGLSMLDVNVSYKDYPAIMRTYGYNNVK